MQQLLITILSLILFADGAIVKTSFGSVEGTDVENFRSFRKVPFAKPPIGKLRFQKPEKPDKWKGILNAKEYGPACMSNSSTTSSPQKWVDEDCLHVNIFTSENCLKSKDCAVIVYIHGGEMLYDSAVMFNDTVIFDAFASRDVVLVIPAFRLGIFSHFVVKDQSVAPNNLGLFDIVHGLEFVKSEIHHFGGSNKHITLLGHSYGAHVVSTLQFSTKVNRDMSLFQKSVSMSTVLYFDTLELQIEKTKRFVDHANCSVPLGLTKKLSEKQHDYLVMKCLQKKDALELLRIQRSLEDAGFPAYDGHIIREPLIQEVSLAQLFETPQKMPTMVGCTSLELDKFMAYHDISKAMGYKNYEECDEKYRRDKKKKNFDFEGHADETLAIIAQTQLKTNKLLENKVPTYLYEYSYPKHASHTDDLSYLFGVHSFEQDENEAHLSEVYRNMFVNFAKYGNPGNGFIKTNLENSSYFDVYWNENTGARPTMKDGFERKMNNYFLGEMVEFDRNVTAFKKSKSVKVPTARFFNEISDHDQLPYMYISLLLISLIFFTGCIVGKICCTGPNERHLYIQLDGNDHDWTTVKNF
ncbi:hypothetical protein L5515_011098 [Caenorhabditis briggsae]|uniref:Carboxylesterase type B domain-containing protein n=2 Tax=Caenorhabditis briggsae TaxID=6238 RepID=A0AAE9JGH8_CAEBR|nr:hypothetical protein L5515_011098 [Caenorhabditis briggsae]